MPTAASRLTRPNDVLFANSARRSVPSLSFHGEGLLQNPRGRLRQLVFRQLLFACEGDVGHIASSDGLARYPFPKAVNDYIMQSRTLLPLVRPCAAFHVRSHEHFDELYHAYLQP